MSGDNNEALGHTEATAIGATVSIGVLIYPKAIFVQSQRDYDPVSPTMKHLAIYAQMHEYADVLQFRHTADDDPNKLREEERKTKEKRLKDLRGIRDVLVDTC